MRVCVCACVRVCVCVCVCEGAGDGGGGGESSHGQNRKLSIRHRPPTRLLVAFSPSGTGQGFSAVPEWVP